MPFSLLRPALLALSLHLPAFVLHSSAQRPPEQPNAAEILHRMQKLNVLGSVLYIVAHPDDENTRLITWLANGRKVRTGNLSLTRGDGGQNLIGPELGDALGIIRTQELMEARRIDGGEQFFTRAVDFGYSKNAAESFEKWGKQEVLSDVVRVIRTFRPDVIITRFAPDRSAGHGHHEASAILAHEAFDLAGDPKAFPEQLEQGLEAWQPRRLFFNGSTWWKKDLAEFAKTDADWFTVDVGGYDPLLGVSYTELAGRSRSMHKSQGFGAAETRGESLEYLKFVKGDRPKTKDIFEGIDMTWGRVKGAGMMHGHLDRMIQGYDVLAPERCLSMLAESHQALQAMPSSPWQGYMLRSIEDIAMGATGTVIEALSRTPQVVTGSELPVEISALTRSTAAVEIMAPARASGSYMNLTRNQPLLLPDTLHAPLAPDMPFWLRSSHDNRYVISDPTLIGLADVPGDLGVDIRVRFADKLVITRRIPVLHRWVDRVKGEQVKACVIVPPTSLFASPSVVMVREKDTPVRIGIQAFEDIPDLELVCEMVADWEIGPGKQDLGPVRRNDRVGAELRIDPMQAKRPIEPYMRTAGGSNGPGNLTLRTIEHDHIMPQTWYTRAIFRAVPLQVSTTAKRVGYIDGAGDGIPRALEQLGVQVDMLDPAMITAESLKPYDAIVTGIRAYNTVKSLKQAQPILMKYVEDGGTLVVQYNTSPRFGLSGVEDFVIDPATLGPYPMKITRDRVTVEEAPATFLDPKHPLLNTPNKITAADFDGWVQERGLYFLGELDPHYTPLIAWNDPGEQPLNGGLVTCDYGKGRYVYTGISFFRQLPAGVPGAYRLFANLISKRADTRE